MKRIFPRLAIATAIVVTAAGLGGWTASTSTSGLHRGQDATVTIYLTRHGQTILNTVERVQGWADSPLIESGRALPVTVGKNIRAREGRFDAAYSADMKRHFETANYILQGAKQKLAVTQDAGLREINFGHYEGSENKEMWTAMVEHLGYVVNHDAAATAPDGWQTMQIKAIQEKGLKALMQAMKEIAATATLPAENCDDVSARMRASLDGIAKKAVKHHDDKVLVVSSGLSITCFLDALGTTVNTGISNVAVSKLEYSHGTWTVVSVNDKSYQQ